MINYDEEKLAICLCEDCPSYLKPVFPKKDGVFCALGKSDEISYKKGCLCKMCPVYSDNGLKGSFFCIEGPAD